MQVILLAAGESSRMAPLSDKNLIKICGKTILEHQVDNIISAGLSDFLIVCNSGNISEIQALCKKRKATFKFVIQEIQKDGMKGAISSCKQHAKKQVFIISGNDIVEKSIIKEMFVKSQKGNLFGLICGKKVENYFPGGYIKLDKTGNLISIVEKPGAGKEPSDQINLVLHVWNDFGVFHKNLEKFHNSTDDAYEKNIQDLVQQKKIVGVVAYSGYWQAVKYPWHLLSLNKYFLSKQKNSIHKSVIKGKNVVIKGKGVVIERGVKINDGSIISGPCYIGENTIIGNNVLIRDSVVGKNCVIGFSSEVCRSLLQDSVWTHSNYIGDSVIMNNVSFGSGSVTGNLRLDEGEIKMEIKGEKIGTGMNKVGCFIGENCRIGINTSLNPGIKICGNSIIGGGISLVENVNSNSYVYGKTELIIKENKIKIEKR